eukprot:scaffold68492_cov52-Attheya_sp.AAC.2
MAPPMGACMSGDVPEAWRAPTPKRSETAETVEHPEVSLPQPPPTAKKETTTETEVVTKSDNVSKTTSDSKEIIVDSRLAMFELPPHCLPISTSCVSAT